jgi:hypothetical protein
MTKPSRIKELLARIHNGSEEVVDVEYLGQFLVNGPYTLRVPSDGLEQEWAASVVPIEYFPLYGLKCDRPEKAGGLFDAAPFARINASDLQNAGLNLPSEPEPIFELCTDSCGAQFWVGESRTVYGHNLDNKFQPVGPLAAFVDFAIEMALQEKCWHRCLRDTAELTPFELSSINMMG